MKRFLGIDYGEKRIGLALSDPMGMIASPYNTIINNEKLIPTLHKIIADKNVGKVVIGFPIGLRGQETVQTKRVLAFIAQLQEEGLDVELEDERLSSISSKKELIRQGIKTGHNKALIDQTSAALILQQYLNRD